MSELYRRLASINIVQSSPVQSTYDEVKLTWCF